MNIVNKIFNKYFSEKNQNELVIILQKFQKELPVPILKPEFFLEEKDNMVVMTVSNWGNWKNGWLDKDDYKLALSSFKDFIKNSPYKDKVETSVEAFNNTNTNEIIFQIKLKDQ